MAREERNSSGRQQRPVLVLLPGGRAWTKDNTRKGARAEEGRADHDRDELQTGVKNNRPKNEPACRDSEEVAEPRAPAVGGIEALIERIGDRIEAVNRVSACRAGQVT